MHIRRNTSQVVVHAPAKINLFLEVLARRADGLHEIETLMQAVTIRDTLHLSSLPGPELRLACRWAGGLVARSQSHAKLQLQSQSQSFGIEATEAWGDLPVGQANIVIRALKLLRDRAGLELGADVQLVKRIPSAAGLGGASSDAAAALLAANEAWGLHWSRERLAELSAELGSDIPFFFATGAAICRGRGELIEPLPARRLHVVIVRPPVGLSTPQVYSRCRPAESPARIEPLASALAQGNLPLAGARMYNRLQAPAEELTPWIERLQSAFNRLDGLGHQMSGSGSSYFGVCRHARHARRSAARLRGMKLGIVMQATTAIGT
jgi:4-diphosphocytidyl-2-C-methyl-D-erythritol kinase